jgi:hypothetical protein
MFDPQNRRTGIRYQGRKWTWAAPDDGPLLGRHRRAGMVYLY